MQRKTSVIFEERYDNYNFFLTNFEPFQVFNLMKQN